MSTMHAVDCEAKILAISRNLKAQGMNSVFEICCRRTVAAGN